MKWLVEETGYLVSLFGSLVDWWWWCWCYVCGCASVVVSHIGDCGLCGSNLPIQKDYEYSHDYAMLIKHSSGQTDTDYQSDYIYKRDERNSNMKK